MTFAAVIKTLVPNRFHFAGGRAWRRLRNLGFQRYCPVCRSPVRRFRDFGVPPFPMRPDAECPVCNSLERHRLVWMYLNQRTDLFDGRPRRLLHFAPEAELSRRLKRQPGLEYLSADLHSPTAMMSMDITSIPFPDRSFDVVYCSHVLDDVPDDRQALRELRRVLKPDGWALLLVPVCETLPTTIEYGGEREDGNVRQYGLDFLQRLQDAHFAVDVERFADRLPRQTVERCALSQERLFLCRPLIRPETTISDRHQAALSVTPEPPVEFHVAHVS